MPDIKSEICGRFLMWKLRQKEETMFNKLYHWRTALMYSWSNTTLPVSLRSYRSKNWNRGYIFQASSGFCKVICFRHEHSEAWGIFLVNVYFCWDTGSPCIETWIFLDWSDTEDASTFKLQRYKHRCISSRFHRLGVVRSRSLCSRAMGWWRESSSCIEIWKLLLLLYCGKVIVTLLIFKKISSFIVYHCSTQSVE